MGYLKLNQAEMAEPIPIRVTTRLGAQAGINGRGLSHLKRAAGSCLSGTDQNALARIAERFAPGGQSAFAPEQQSFVGRPAGRLVVASPQGVRTLIAVLIAAALLPNSIFAAMIWFGAVGASWSASSRSDTEKGTPPAAKSPTVMAAVEAMPSWQTTESLAARLDAPAELEAQAGGTVPFAITLDRTETLPARSVVAIGGLPRGAALSAGRPYGDGEWNLRADETGDLRLALGDVAAGESTLRVRVIAPDGEIVAATETVLKVTGKPAAADTHALPAAALYEPSPFGFVAWDEQVAGSIGIAELITDGEAAPLANAPPPPAAAEAAEDDAEVKWVEPSAYVNLRKGPSSSSAVIGVIPKGTKLSLEARKRGWMRVTNPKTAASGWIYAGNVEGETVRRSRTRAANAGSEDNSATLWSGLGTWLKR